MEARSGSVLHETNEPDCACAGIVGFYGEAIDALVKVILKLHREKKILDDRECKTIRYIGASEYECYFALAFALLAKPHEKVKTAITVLENSQDPQIVQDRRIPQFLNVCLDLHKLLDHEDVEEMKRRDGLELIERIIHVVCMKDFATVKELADVMGIYGFSDEKDWLLVYVKLHEERVLTDEDVQDLKKMIAPFLQRIWRLLRSKDPDALRKAGDIFQRYANLRTVFPERETVGDPMPPPQRGHGTVGDPRPSSQPDSSSSRGKASASSLFGPKATVHGDVHVHTYGNVESSTVSSGSHHHNTAGPLSTGEEKLIKGSTYVPVHEWRKCENAVVRVRCKLPNYSPVHFTAFFMEDESGKVFFTTCFHNLCNEDKEGRKKLTAQDFAQRLKECTCDPFYISSSDSFTEVVKFKGDIILSGEDLPTLCLEKDYVMYPTKLDAINNRIRSALTKELGVDGDILKSIIEQHYQVQAISLKIFFDISKKSKFPDPLQGIVLGHPDGRYLTYATYKMSLKPDEKIDHFMSTKDGSSGSPLFFVHNKEPVLCGIHCGHYKGERNPNYGWQIFSQDVLPK